MLFADAVLKIICRLITALHNKFRHDMNDKYELTLYLANKYKSSSVIENHSYLNAASVYERIFLSCDEEVIILARGIKQNIFNQLKVITSAKKFLKKPNVKLKMYLRCKDSSSEALSEKSDFLREIKESIDDVSKLDVRYFKGDDSWLLDTPSITLGDDRIYRKRRLQADGDYNKSSESDVCFNDAETVVSFKNKINRLLEIG